MLLTNDNEMERAESITFLGVLLDEHLSWKGHIRNTENKVAKIARALTFFHFNVFFKEN